MKAPIYFLLLGALVARAAEPPPVAAESERSVIQITVFVQTPMWNAPWRFDSVRRATGTGFVISGKRIMTNAHVINWARQILVKKMGDPRPYLAEVEFVGADCDLALLTVEDESFFDGLEALEFGELPEVRSTVVTYGYPAGGEQISYTRGVVSRIEMQPYVNIGNRTLLAVQTDAAINPGNSGGPVIQDGKVVGVAFQGQPGLENAGFFIPPNVIHHFLEDVNDGTYHGFPQAGVRLSSTFNPALREYLEMPDGERGVLIDSIVSDTTGEHLELQDVVLQVGEYPVASDGTIVYHGNIVNMAMAIGEYQHGEKVPATVWRDGRETTVEVPVYVQEDDRAAGNQYSPPKYYIYAGLVFTPLSRDYLSTLGRSWMDSVSQDIIYELFYKREAEPDKKRPEPVMLADVLTHPVNVNFETKGRVMVDSINGIRIDRMEDVVRAFESDPDREMHLIEFSPLGHLEGLDRADADAANDEILTQFGISSDRRL